METKRICYVSALLLACCTAGKAQDQGEEIRQYKGYELVWHDEFDVDGAPDPANWTFERGFVRNQEDQWYQEDNAFCEGGRLIIEGRKERFPNPEYGRYNDWRNREYVDYTSACVTTDRLHSWTYGRFVIRAKIPAFTGCWPAIWTLGQQYNGLYSWPHNGEIDIMEFYQIGGKPYILANACWGSTTSKYSPTWNTKTTPYSMFLAQDPEWGEKFHEWRMDWDENYIKLYLDDELLNVIPLVSTVNPQTTFFNVEGYNPFRKPQYLLLNLALGGINGGSLSNTPFPCRYEIDYVRVYQKSASAVQSVADAVGADAVGAEGRILLSCPEGTSPEVCVADLSGREVWRGSVEAHGGPCVLPFRPAPGVYVVRTVVGGESVSSKVMVW